MNTLSVGLSEVGKYLPILVPYLVVELLLMIISVVHVARHNKYRFGNKVMWLLIVVFIQIIGPVVYFAIGREEE